MMWNKQKKVALLVTCGVLFLTACNKEVVETTAKIDNNQEVVAVKQEPNKVSDSKKQKEQLMNFFRKYFDITKQDMLNLNKLPQDVDGTYWEVYKQTVERFKNDWKSYFTEEKLKQFSKQYMHTFIHFPRFVEINGYVITDTIKVEDVRYQMFGEKENKKELKVFVTALVKTIPENVFGREYKWDSQKGYYEGTSKNQDINKQADEMRVQYTYKLGITEGETLKIDSIKESSGMVVPEESRRLIANNDFVKRVLYQEKVDKEDEASIGMFFTALFNQKSDLYDYYKKAYKSDFAAFQEVIKDGINVADYVTIEGETYRSCFAPTILPIKDTISSVKTTYKEIKAEGHMAGTKNLQWYNVSVPANVVRRSKDVTKELYKYVVVCKKHKIVSVKYIGQCPMELQNQNQQDTKEQTEKE